MKIGFTGSQHGMTKEQWNSIVQIIKKLNPIEVHHGDCIGSDTQFHSLCAAHIKTIIHPPNDKSKRAFNVGYIVLPLKPYLKRNQDIVNACDLLIATPKEKREVLRSGTWATIRYARKVNVPRIILLP